MLLPGYDEWLQAPYQRRECAAQRRSLAVEREVERIKADPELLDEAVTEYATGSFAPEWRTALQSLAVSGQTLLIDRFVSEAIREYAEQRIDQAA